MLRKTNLAASCIAHYSQSSLRLPSFQHFPLNHKLQKYLQEQNIHTPTYIQYSLLSKLFKNSPQSQNTNYHIVSPTGSGKTLAYMLPIINDLKMQEQQQKMKLTKPQRPRAIVFTASKQLILQARNVGKGIGHHCKIKCEGISIGRSLPEQKKIVEDGVDILFTSLMRFSRMFSRRQVFLSDVQWIVIDELDTIFQAQNKSLTDLLENILLPKLSKPSNYKNPKLLLSSTTNPLPLTTYLSKTLIKQHKIPFQQIIDKQSHINLQNIHHQFIHCSTLDKHDPLIDELRRSIKKINKNDSQSLKKVLIFCNTVKSLHELEYYLQSAGITPNLMTLHSQLNKVQRLRNYERFRDLPNNQIGIMLSTDLGARGLHFPNLNYIINYDFPLSTCDYLQRAGRTGRAGAKGNVVSFYHKKNLPIVNQLKDASFNTPLKIGNSAYGLKNRQQSSRNNKFASNANK